MLVPVFIKFQPMFLIKNMGALGGNTWHNFVGALKKITARGTYFEAKNSPFKIEYEHKTTTGTM